MNTIGRLSGAYCTSSDEDIFALHIYGGVEIHREKYYCYR